MIQSNDDDDVMDQLEDPSNLSFVEAKKSDNAPQSELNSAESHTPFREPVNSDSSTFTDDRPSTNNNNEVVSQMISGDITVDDESNLIQQQLHQSEPIINTEIQKDRYQTIIRNLNNAPKFSDEWFRLKEQEISFRNGLEAEQGNISDGVSDNRLYMHATEITTDSERLRDAEVFIGSLETLPERGPPLPYAQIQHVDDAGTITRADCNDVKMNDNKREVKGSGPVQMSPEPSPVPFTGDPKGIYKSKVKSSGPVQMSPEPSPVPFTGDPNGIYKSKVKGSDLVQISPEPSPAPVTGDANAICKIKVKGSGLLRMSPEPSPVPFTGNEEENTGSKKKAAIETSASNNSSIDRGNDYDSGEGNVSRGNGNYQLNSRHVEMLHAVRENQIAQNETSLEDSSRYDIEARMQISVSTMGNTAITPSTLFDRNASVSQIPEAFLVEEDDEKEIATAELVLPFWKQKQTYFIFFVIALIITSVTVGVAVAVKRNLSQQLNGGALVVANTTTTAPSISVAPSSSQAPSSRPSACVERMSVEPRQLEFEFFNLTQAVCAIDGGHAVVVDIHVQDGITRLYVVFYAFMKDGGWDRLQRISELLSSGNDTDLDIGGYLYDRDSNWDGTYSVAMSGNTVLVGTPFVINGTGEVFVYEYNERISEWERIYNAIMPDDGGKQGRRFGQSLDIDGDLAIIHAPGDEATFVFLRDGVTWKQMTTFDIAAWAPQIVLSGNTIAATMDSGVRLFEYNRTASRVTRRRSPSDEFVASNIGSIALSENHLAIAAYLGSDGWESSGNGCWNPYRAMRGFPLFDIMLYHRSDASKPFTFLRLLNSSDFDQGFGPYLNLDEDTLLVGGAGNQSHAFTYSSGHWEESLVLTTPDECGADGYSDTLYISKRNVMVSSENSIYIFDIDECAPMPTSVPSSSPSSNPTTTCYMIEIFAEHHHAKIPSWHVVPLNETGDVNALHDAESSTIVPTLRPTFQYAAVFGYDPFHITYASETMCLQEGLYEFTIFNDPLHYNLTSYGHIIAEGGDFGYQESTIFQVPFE